MTKLRVAMPPELDRWIDQRLDEGRHVSRSEYICDLIRRDEAAAVKVVASAESVRLTGLAQDEFLRAEK